MVNYLETLFPLVELDFKKRYSVSSFFDMLVSTNGYQVYF